VPDSFLAGGVVTIEQASPDVSCSGSVTVAGSDTGAASGTVTISRSRFLSYSVGLGTGVYAVPVRHCRATLMVDGVDFSDSRDGDVEITETLDGYIANRTARFGLLDERLAYAHASTISDEEKRIAIDFHVGPDGYPSTWRSFEGYIVPTQNDEPFRPAATFQARSWLADLLGAHVCLFVPAFAGYTREDLLILAAASAGWEITITGGPRKTVRKPQRYNGVSFGQVAARLLELMGCVLREKSYGALELVPESEWLRASVTPDLAVFTFHESDGVSYLPISEQPPMPEVTSWTIHGTQIGPGQSTWTDGTYENGVTHTVYWQWTGALFIRHQLDATRQEGVQIAGTTTVQIFEALFTPGEPFYYNTVPFFGGQNIDQRDQQVIHAHPTRLLSESISHDNDGARVSTISRNWTWGTGYLPDQLVVQIYGLNGADIFGLLRTTGTTWSGDETKLEEGYTATTHTTNAAATLIETKTETWTVRGSGGWQKTTVTHDHTGGMPSVTVDLEEGEGPIPLPYMADAESPIYELQEFSRTVMLDPAALTFRQNEKEETIEEAEDAAEGTAVAWRRLRWQLSRSLVREGLILPTLRVGDAGAVGDRVRDLEEPAGGLVTMVSMAVGRDGDQVSRRAVTVPPSYMLEPS